MKYLLCFTLTLSLFVVHDSVGQSFKGADEQIQLILKNIDNFSKHYVNQDYDQLAASYCEDGVILPPGSEIIKGREDIKSRWQLPEGVRISHHKISPVEIHIMDDHAYDIGTYEGTTVQQDGTQQSWKGKYLIIWKKEDQNWKIYADAWNRIN